MATQKLDPATEVTNEIIPAGALRGTDRISGTARRTASVGAFLRQKGGLGRTLADKRGDIRDRRPRGLSVKRGCELTGVARSSD